jgi:hypothetical protein
MNRKDLLVFLGLELFAIVWAGLVFSLLPSKLFAGAMAGGYFVVFGLFVLYRISRWSRPWRSLTIYPLLVHVFGVAIPMLVTRFVHADLDFSQVKVWGLPGPVFHQLSTTIFSLLIAATVIDLLRVKLANKGIS